jgi:hypothetical protein
MVPTDLEILKFIYTEYKKEFSSFQRDQPNRLTKNYVPVDIQRAADHFRVDADIIFGRLYGFLNDKHSFEKDGATTSFFQNSFGNDPFDHKHLINFPLASSVLAEMEYRDRLSRKTRNLATWSIVIALISLFLAFGKFIFDISTSGSC